MTYLVAGKPTGTMGYVPGQIETYRLAEASCHDVPCGRKTDRDYRLCPQADVDVVCHFVLWQENRQGPWVMSPGRQRRIGWLKRLVVTYHFVLWQENRQGLWVMSLSLIHI